MILHYMNLVLNSQVLVLIIKNLHHSIIYVYKMNQENQQLKIEMGFSKNVKQNTV